ncbi:MAG: hypothetical protein PUC32_00920 [Oscillospiraceae bacterium]|nr:hypothetical protein [Oscillospiraceae bacterium]
MNLEWEIVLISLGFFAAALIATVASIALSFWTSSEWAVACGAAGGIFSLAGMFFPLQALGKKK